MSTNTDIYHIEINGSPLSEDDRKNICDSLPSSYSKMDAGLCILFSHMKERDFEGGMESKVAVIVRAEPGLKLKGLRESRPFYTGTPTIGELLNILKNDDVKYVHLSCKLKPI